MIIKKLNGKLICNLTSNYSLRFEIHVINILNNRFEEKIQFPCNLLPDVKESSYLMSKSVNVFDLIQTDAFIYNALGDLQCSVYSCLQDQSDCGISCIEK